MATRDPYVTNDSDVNGGRTKQYGQLEFAPVRISRTEFIGGLEYTFQCDFAPDQQITAELILSAWRGLGMRIVYSAHREFCPERWIPTTRDMIADVFPNVPFPLERWKSEISARTGHVFTW